MGGIETTRHLLNLRGDRKADGEGVYSPHLGRYFADHFGISPGLVLAPAELHYSRFADPSGPVMPVLTFAESEIRDSGQNNCCIYLWAESGDGSLLDGYAALPSLGFRAGEYWHYHVKMILEPQPNYDSSISLTDKVCPLGLRRARLDWRIHDADFASAYQLMDTLGRELGGSGQGRMQITQGNTPALRAEVTGGCHHMGTVRMAATSEDGVTDANLKVFGSDNLYIASSAVIPRYGYSNPTLTIVALSVRLAHHLAGAGPTPLNGQVSNDQTS
jgi:choline dehydrogenase-like flavoprotein